MASQIILLFSLTTSLILCNCGDNPLQSSADDSYFPLNINNEWHYDGPEILTSVIFIDSTMTIAGYTYFKTNQAHYYRASGGIVYEFADGEEHVYINFNNSIGQKTKHYKYNRTQYIESKSAKADLNWLEQNRPILNDCIILVDESDIDIIRTWYARGIGPVKREMKGKNGAVIGGLYYLTKAIINGVKFP